MKANKLTPGKNVLWESSRMMLPQHKETSLLQDKKSVKKVRPEFTDEELEEMFGRLKTAKANTLEVAITVFGDIEDREITGIVTGLDLRLHLIKIEANHDWQLIDFVDVIRVEFGDDFYPF